MRRLCNARVTWSTSTASALVICLSCGCEVPSRLLCDECGEELLIPAREQEAA
jgi:hypothetical protein